MDTKAILCLLIILVLIILIFYYYYYYINNVDSDEIKKKIPYDILYKNECTIVDVFKTICNKYGRYTAFKNNNKSITYSKYYDNTQKFSEKILYHIGPHAKIGIISSNRPEWYYTYFGSMMGNCIPIGLYSLMSSNDYTEIIKHNDIDLLVVENLSQLNKLKDIKMESVKIILLLDEIDALTEYYENKMSIEEQTIEPIINEYDIDSIKTIKQNNENISIISYDIFINKDIGSYKTNASIELGKIYPENIATIVYTNGTIGLPKKVIIYHKHIIELMKSFVNIMLSRSNISLYVQEIFVSHLPLNQTIIQFTDIYLPLLCIGIVNFCDKIDTNIIQEIKPTIFVGTPKIWNKFYERMKDNYDDNKNFVDKLFIPNIDIGLKDTKYCINVNGSLLNDTKIFFDKIGIEICNIYGMTETTGITSICVPSCSKGVGIPIVNIKIDSNTNEILVKGGNVCINNNNWFNTGDIGYIDRDETLYITNRKNDIYIAENGNIIQLNVIENKLLDELNKEIHYFEHIVSYVENDKIFIMLIPSKKYDISVCDNSYIMKAIENVNTQMNDKILIDNNFFIVNDTLSSMQDCFTQTNNIKRDVIIQKYK